MSRPRRDTPREGTASYKVWAEVASHGPLTTKQVIERTSLRPATVSSVAQKLIERGLLDRDEATDELKLP